MASLTYSTSSLLSFPSGPTVTYTGVSYGAGADFLVLVMGTFANGVSPITALTVSGISASVIAGTQNNPGNNNTEIWTVPGGSVGSSGNIVVTYSGGATLLETTVNIYKLVATSSVASDAQNTSVSGTSISQNITIPSGGAAVAIVQNGTENNTYTWTNAISDHANPSSNVAHNTSSSGVVSITATNGNAGNDGMSLSLASWSLTSLAAATLQSQICM